MSSSFRHTSFKNCKLVGINWSTVNSVSLISFFECVLDLCSFMDIDLSSCEFKNSKIHDVEFSSCNLKRASFENSSLKNSNFTGANCEEVNFEGAKDYYIDPHHTNLKDAQFSLPEAISLFSAMEIKISY